MTPYERSIPSLNHLVGREVADYVDRLTKPIGSLGRLETIAIELAAMTGEKFPTVTPPAAIVFAADHGITEEGVSAYPKEVTAQMVNNFLSGGAAMNVFCHQIDALFAIVDVGVAADLDHQSLTMKKIRPGTRNFYREEAMTEAEAKESIAIGRQEAQKMMQQGAKCLIVGEMGIGNSSSATAIISAITGKEVGEITGPGTGLDEGAREHKARILEVALQKRQVDPQDPIDLLKKIGGYEIGAMAGAMLEAARNRMPIIVDGLICTAAALLAKRIEDGVSDYMFVGHQSVEPAHRIALQWLGKEALLDLNLRLGEGSGAALAFPIIHAASNMLKHMATFQAAGVSTKT